MGMSKLKVFLTLYDVTRHVILTSRDMKKCAVKTRGKKSRGKKSRGKKSRSLTCEHVS